MATKEDLKVMDGLRKIHGVWANIQAKMPKDLDIKLVETTLKTGDDGIKASDLAEAQALATGNKKDAALVAVNELAKRLRSSVKGSYGDDSNEYEMVGGKRRSERKKPTRKPKVAKPDK